MALAGDDPRRRLILAEFGCYSIATILVETLGGASEEKQRIEETIRELALGERAAMLGLPFLHAAP